MGSAGSINLVDRKTEARGMILDHKASPPRRHSSRRGITILEIMVLMTGVAAMLTLCAVTIHLLMRLNTDSQTRLSAAVTLERLARQIRQDAHACDNAQLEDAKSAGSSANLRLTLDPMHDVRYEPQRQQVVRIETRDGKRSRHESYSLPPASHSRFEFRDEGKRRLIVLVVTHDPGRNAIEPPRAIEVAALQGKDRVGPLGKPGGEKQ
jgi:type II secretory pathway component PulJ